MYYNQNQFHQWKRKENQRKVHGLFSEVWPVNVNVDLAFAKTKSTENIESTETKSKNLNGATPS